MCRAQTHRLRFQLRSFLPFVNTLREQHLGAWILNLSACAPEKSDDRSGFPQASDTTKACNMVPTSDPVPPQEDEGASRGAAKLELKTIAATFWVPLLPFTIHDAYGAGFTNLGSQTLQLPLLKAPPDLQVCVEPRLRVAVPQDGFVKVVKDKAYFKIPSEI
ncbi:hypothetical protein A6R68_15093, partial [Neotoma lepida]